MTPHVFPDARQVAAFVADQIQTLLVEKQDAALGLATGGTMVPIYDELTRRYDNGHLRLAPASAYLLDEYVGLGCDDRQSYKRTIEQLLASRTDLSAQRVHSPDGSADDLATEARRYDRLVSEAKIDLQLLGIGGNGHLAFNEPGSSLASRTRPVELSPATVSANSRFFPSIDAVPTMAITQGLGTIRQAELLILVAFGDAKSDAVRLALEGPITAMLPASVVQLHENVVVVLDEAAASKLAVLHSA